MSGLRFCMVTTFYPPYNFGGDGMGVQRLSQALVRRGHQVTILQDIDAFNVLSGTPEPTATDQADGVEIVRLRNALKGLSVTLTHQSGRPIFNGRKFRRFFEEREFDIINFHNVSQVGGAGILAYGDGIKLYMAHEHWLVCPTHVLWRHKREVCTGRECLRCSFHYRRPPQLWRYTDLLRRQISHVDTFIAMSEFSRRKHREFGFERDMEVVNYFLPEKSATAPVAEQPSPHPRPYFLFVGRLERIKGLDEVIPLFRRYQDADLLIVGEGEHRPVLTELAGGISNVKFVGRLAPASLDRYYRHALALIVPSVCFETFGIILIEAFRQATPVLARRIGPFPEIVERGGGGVLFDGPEDLLQSMKLMQNDPQLRPRLSRAGFESFRAHWSESAVIPRYLDIVRRSALAKGRPGVAAAADS